MFEVNQIVLITAFGWRWRGQILAKVDSEYLVTRPIGGFILNNNRRQNCKLCGSASELLLGVQVGHVFFNEINHV